MSRYSKRKTSEDIAAEKMEAITRDFMERPYRSTGKIVGIGIALFIVLGIVFSIVGFASDWWSEGKRVVGVENTRLQTTEIKRDLEDMRAAARQVCDIESTKVGSDSQQFVEDPALAYKSTYYRIQADYDRRMTNFFEAGVTKRMVFLAGVPEKAPTLTAMKTEVC